MAKSRRAAGRTIRMLALSRRFKAIQAFITAGFIAYLPFALARMSEVFRQMLVTTNSDPLDAPALPPIIYVVAIIMALGLIMNGIFLWKRANHADQGAKGEEDTAYELHSLVAEGWHFEYGKYVGKGIGDIDIICRSPKNKTYVIDVKSHKGNVVTDGKMLFRRVGKTEYPFEKNFLAQVTKQALQVKRHMDTKFVTPIVAFSNARVIISAGNVKHVYVVEKCRLAGLLRKLG